MTQDLEGNRGTRLFPLKERSGRVAHLAVLLLANWLVVTALFVPTALRWDALGLEWLAIGVLAGQVYLCSFWAAWRGGPIFLQQGLPCLLLVLGGIACFGILALCLGHWPEAFTVMPVPLACAYFWGITLLSPYCWWSGRALVFADEEPLPRRPWQIRLAQLAGWTTLIALTMGLARAAVAVEGVRPVSDLMFIIAVIVGYIMVISAPLVRGVFANSRPLLWSIAGLLFVVASGLVIGLLACVVLTVVRGMSPWQMYAITLAETAYFHVGLGLVLWLNLAVLRQMGLAFARARKVEAKNQRTTAHDTTQA